MGSTGIICEYNPFHRGHEYLLSQREPGDTAICLMSGNFTQRGEAALLPPRARAEMALQCGADAVLELPFPFSVSSAEHFARAGVRALAALGVDRLLFGSECADTEKLLLAAKKLCAPAYGALLEEKGRQWGAVRLMFEYLGEEFSSNDLLGIHYIKAIVEEDLPLTPVALARVGAGYLDTDPSAAYPSAAALRAKLSTGGGILEQLPQRAAPVWLKNATRYGTADIRRLGNVFLALLRREKAKRGEGTVYAECEGGLLPRLIGAAETAVNYEELCIAAANKLHTDGRIRRALLMFAAGVRPEDLTASPAYLRLLGFNENGKTFLANTRKTRRVPVVTRLSELRNAPPAAARQRALSAVCDGLFSLCFPSALSPAELQKMPPCTIK